jgi:hypothetical protein
MIRKPAKQIVKDPRKTCCWIQFTSSYQLNKLTPGISYLVTVQRVNYLVENTYTIWGSKVIRSDAEQPACVLIPVEVRRLS